MPTPLTLAGRGAAALAVLLFLGFANDPERAFLCWSDSQAESL